MTESKADMFYLQQIDINHTGTMHSVHYYAFYHGGTIRSLGFPSPPIGDPDCRDVII